MSPDGPYGVRFEPDADGHSAVIKVWERLPNGKFGPLQKHGGLHYGDILFSINDTQVDIIPHSETLNMINDRNTLKKVFKFMNSGEYYRRKLVCIYALYISLIQFSGSNLELPPHHHRWRPTRTTSYL